MKLHTITTGDGPKKVALVHGIGASADLWGALAERIAASGEYTAIAVDLRLARDSSVIKKPFH